MLDEPFDWGDRHLRIVIVCKCGEMFALAEHERAMAHVKACIMAELNARERIVAELNAREPDAEYLAEMREWDRADFGTELG